MARVARAGRFFELWVGNLSISYLYIYDIGVWLYHLLLLRGIKGPLEDFSVSSSVSLFLGKELIRLLSPCGSRTARPTTHPTRPCSLLCVLFAAFGPDLVVPLHV